MLKGQANDFILEGWKWRALGAEGQPRKAASRRPSSQPLMRAHVVGAEGGLGFTIQSCHIVEQSSWLPRNVAPGQATRFSYLRILRLVYPLERQS